MSPLGISAIVFACICAGIFLGAWLPGHRMAEDTKDVVRLGTGLIGTMSALVLGLLIASAKSSYDMKGAQVRQITANMIVLDQLLKEFGPHAHIARQLIRETIPSLIERIWHENEAASAKATAFAATAASETAFINILQLAPKDDIQNSLKARAVQTATDLAQTRILLFTQSANAIPVPFLAVLVFWLTIIFASFSLFAHPNAVAIVALLLFAFSASAAIFLIIELSEPFAGMMAISSEPLRQALPLLAPQPNSSLR